MVPITAFMPTYNAAKYLPRALDAVLAQTRKFDEILVVDDGSRDNSDEIFAHYPQVTVIRHTANKGVAAARNTGFRAARNEIVASVDSDVLLEPNWLATLLPHLDDPKVVGVGAFVIEGVQKTLADKWRRARMSHDWGAQRHPPYLHGSNTLYRRNAVLEVGGYNETLLSAGEDTELCMKLGAKGWKQVFDPTPLATHLRHDTLKSVMDMYWRWWKYGNQAYPGGVTLRSWLGHALFVHFRYNFLGPAKVDLSQGRLDLLAMDFLALAYMPYRDLRLWMDPKRGVASRKL